MLYDWGTLIDTSPRKLAHQPELAAYLLTPGFTRGYHRRVLGVSNATLWSYLNWARAHADRNPAIREMISANLASITCDDGIAMARRRGSTHLPFWSRLAICEMLQHESVPKVAAIFNCSKRTVNNVSGGRCVAFDPLSGIRYLSRSQLLPPASLRRSRSKMGMIG